MIKAQYQILHGAIKGMKQQQNVYQKSAEQDMKANFNCMIRLAHMGILTMADISADSIRWGLRRDVQREDLPRIRKAVGRVRVSDKGMMVEGDVVSQTHIRVTVCPVECSSIRLVYVKELHEGARCSVKEITHPAVAARTEFALVCDSDSQY